MLLRRVRTGGIPHPPRAAAGPHRRRRAARRDHAATASSACQTRSPNATTWPRRRGVRSGVSAWHAGSRAEPSGGRATRTGCATPSAREMYLARPLFDLRPVHGRESLWRDIEATVVAGGRPRSPAGAGQRLPGEPAAADVLRGRRGRGIRRAHDRLSPGAQRAAAARGRRARVRHGDAARCWAPRRASAWRCARTLLPEHESIFREASETLRILLWQQARIGIGQGTERIGAAAGAAQPPRSARAEERLPLHPAAARAHRQLRLVRRRYDRRRRSSTAIASASTRPGPMTRRSIRCASSCSIPRPPGSIRAPIASSRSAPSPSAAARSCSRTPSTRC